MLTASPSSLAAHLRALWRGIPSPLRLWLVFGAVVPVTSTAVVYGVIALNGLSAAAGGGCPPNPHALALIEPFATERFVYGVGPYACVDGLPDVRLGLGAMIMLVQGGLVCLSATLLGAAAAWHVLTPRLPWRAARVGARALTVWAAGALTLVMLHVGGGWFAGYMGFMGDGMCLGSFDGYPYLCAPDAYVREATERTLSLIGLAVEVAIVSLWTLACVVVAALVVVARRTIAFVKRRRSAPKTPTNAP